MDTKCFLGSLGVFVKDGSIVEGGTGEIKKKNGIIRPNDGKTIFKEDAYQVKGKGK